MKWKIENEVEVISATKRIVNPSSKSSPIDRRTSRRREEDDPPGDESPPPESAVDTAQRSSRTLKIPVHRRCIAVATPELFQWSSNAIWILTMSCKFHSTCKHY
ncbi:unnamed protein product [Spirodela intermedia]|uniref:Uncharacterized protein n=1 Tax=Spirodela intermedia TaxID=51605 RepID=A0A7I8LHJ6_SPIIN|nr:unnamed protein product [Spirodela intermedia]